MPLTLQCPACEALIQVADARPGATVACPGCQARFLVPSQAPAAPRSAVRQPVAPRPAPVPAPIPTPAVRPSPPSPAAPSGLAPAVLAAILGGGVLLVLAAGGLILWLTASGDGDRQEQTVAAGHPGKRFDIPDVGAPVSKPSLPRPQNPEGTRPRDPPKKGPGPTPELPPPLKGPAQAPPQVKQPVELPPPLKGPLDSQPPAKVDKKEPVKPKDGPPVKPKRGGEEFLVTPLDLNDLKRSDHLTFTLPAAKGNEPPPPAVWDGHTNHVAGVAFTDDGKYVVSVSGDVYQVLVDGKPRPPDHSIRVWDARRGKQVHKLDGFVEALSALSVSRGGRLAVFGHGGHWEGRKWVEAEDTHVRMHDILTNKEVPLSDEDAGPRFRGLGSSVFTTEFSPDRETVLGAANNGQLLLWETKSGKVLTTVQIPAAFGWPRGILCARFTPDGRFILLSTGPQVWLLDARRGQSVATLHSHKDLVWSVAATKTPDGRLLGLSGGGSRQRRDASGFEPGSRDYAIRVWDLEGQRELRQLAGHQHDVTSLAFRPHSRHFLSSGNDKTVRLWDWESGKLLRTYTGHTRPIRSLAVAPDGRSAVSGSDDCTIRYWQLPARAEDLLAALDTGDAAKLEKIIPDMDALAPELRTAFPRLVKGLGQKDAALRPALRQVLRRYGELWRGGVVPPFERGDDAALIALLESGGEADLQILAAEALAKLGPQAERAAPALLKLARANPDARLLASVLAALAATDLKTEEALATFEKNLDHAAAEVQAPAALALVRLAPERLPMKRLMGLMGRANEDVRKAAGALLRQKLASVTRDDLPALRQGLKEPAAEVRLAFLDALASLKDDGRVAVPDVAALLGAPDREVRRQAIRFLKRLHAFAGPAVPELARVVNEEKDVQVAVEATLALHKIDPAHAALEARGIDLLLDGLKADVRAGAVVLPRPLEGPAAAGLLDIGAPAVKPLVRRLLTSNNPKTVADNQGVKATAERYVAYVLLKEMAGRAKADAKLTAALKGVEQNLRAFWSPQEQRLSGRAAGMPPASRQLYVRTAQAARGAYLAIAYLRAPATK